MDKLNLILIIIVITAFIVIVPSFTRKIDTNTEFIEHLIRNDSIRTREEDKKLQSIRALKKSLFEKDSILTIKLNELEKENEDLTKKYNSIRVKLPRY